MAQLELELARDRHESLRAATALQREGERAAIRSRLVRQARRAERRTLNQVGLAERLRAGMPR
jgi:hypothetical protein